MLRKALVMLGMLLWVALAGCGWFRSKPPKLFPVDLCLHASPQLQSYRGQAHTLYVRVYPLTVVDGFASADVGALLADPPPAIPGVVGTAQSRTLYPGTTETLSFDTIEGRTFSHLGIVCGYYELKGPAKHVVPVEKLRTGSCYTVEFGSSAIAGGAPAKQAAEEGK